MSVHNIFVPNNNDIYCRKLFAQELDVPDVVFDNVIVDNLIVSNTLTADNIVSSTITTDAITATNGSFPGGLNAGSISSANITATDLTVTGLLSGADALFDNISSINQTLTGTLTGNNANFSGTIGGVDANFSGNVNSESALISDLNIEGLTVLDDIGANVILRIPPTPNPNRHCDIYFNNTSDVQIPLVRWRQEDVVNGLGSLSIDTIYDPSVIANRCTLYVNQGFVLSSLADTLVNNSLYNRCNFNKFYTATFNGLAFTNSVGTVNVTVTIIRKLMTIGIVNATATPVSSNIGTATASLTINDAGLYTAVGTVNATGISSTTFSGSLVDTYINGSMSYSTNIINQVQINVNQPSGTTFGIGFVFVGTDSSISGSFAI